MDHSFRGILNVEINIHHARNVYDAADHLRIVSKKLSMTWLVELVDRLSIGTIISKITDTQGRFSYHDQLQAQMATL